MPFFRFWYSAYCNSFLRMLFCLTVAYFSTSSPLRSISLGLRFRFRILSLETRHLKTYFIRFEPGGSEANLSILPHHFPFVNTFLKLFSNFFAFFWKLFFLAKIIIYTTNMIILFCRLPFFQYRSYPLLKNHKKISTAVKITTVLKITHKSIVYCRVVSSVEPCTIPTTESMSSYMLRIPLTPVPSMLTDWF